MNTLSDVVERLKNRFKVYAVILFGSRARGDWKPWSDYDLLVIGDFDKDYLDRIGEVLDALRDVRLPVEPHPYTLSEALEMVEKGNPLIISALEEGVVLHSTGEFEKLVKAFEELKKKGLEKTRTSYKLHA
ncbi:nucleotidyltransferase domain-containing protein [Thermofilum pendens]|uniref:Nucleotidyltransferase n=1 Tax=Thermofilum pendens (strain DSM 2475 / Hrk 5) TaxID=368408 RepID=A1S0V6_THEPD|nr:nucleotidyltransferase domain-containing protein [Thermofilum pendens]ABL79086.1 nucleotidyltransferase [Thermofilum pendens Hrk 5]